MENQEDASYSRPSQLRPPSRIPSPGKGLSEITESQNNARAKGISRLAQPLKHKLTGSGGEPEPKRKSLVERAGEPKAAPVQQPATKFGYKGISLTNAGKALASKNNGSLSSSVSARPPTGHSRATSANNFSNSMGPSTRTPTSYGGRPKTAMGFTQSTNGSSYTKSQQEAELAAQEKLRGTPPLYATDFHLPHRQNCSIQEKKMLYRPLSVQSLRPNHLREVSVSATMSKLQIDEEVKSSQSQIGVPSSASVPVDLSIAGCSQLDTTLQPHETGNILKAPKSPSHTPLVSKSEASGLSPSKHSKSHKSPKKTFYLTKYSNIPVIEDWGNIDRRIGEMMSMYESLKDSVEGSAAKHTGLEEAVELYKARITELETLRCELSASNKSLQSDLDLARKQTDHLQERLLRSTSQFDDQIRAHRLEMDNINQQHRNDMDKLRREKTDEIERLIRLHRDDLHALERRAASELEDKIKELEKRGDSRLDEEKARHMRELEVLELQIKSGQQDLNSSLHMKDVELQNMKGELENIKGQLEKERTLKGDAENTLVELRSSMHKTAAETATTVSTLEGTVASLRARIHFLESGSKAQSDSFAEMEARLQEAIQAAEISKQKLIKEETLRRILFNQVQELKGNIRVMCRIRPAFSDEKQVANISYPDVDKESKEIEILGKEEKSSLGNITRKTHAFSFDRVFGPSCTNQEVFGEISQLVQSALDGYNVCIFCYGQTGSGKTHTMSSADGMIPLATNQIYETATNLQEKGWKYTIEGSFIEVYNEEIHDLLGDPKEFDKKKHEIRHDDRKKQTTVTGLKQVPLDSPSTVESILEQAANNRSVAATKANERSSRSHSVFILRLFGKNNATNEISEGTLNLVDLAGSERLKHSGAEGDRMKETQNINKSLACLGDVIGALGQGKEGGHIPYRNSKLTYLLQYSLGGNSKTLMFVMASPLEAHLTETLTSLKFATKVHNTHIGTAKKSTKVREA
ncbi:P-loop containing nucleoside triphosphate hydrolase protein [Xylogone sp. PMI_703]|nr:P-loop containing nucleoside triphosphate hydrolase protein [Xylogone sp. PMI_703]